MNADPIEQERAEQVPTTKAPKPRSSRRPSTPAIADATTELPNADPAGPTGTTAGASAAAPAPTVPAPAGELPVSPIEPRRVERANPVPTNVYRARRPAVAFLLVLPALAIGLLLVKGLAVAAFGQAAGFQLPGVLVSVFGLVSLPFLVGGIYGLVTGAAHGAEHYGFRVWARPPLAYLLVGLAFALIGAIAIR